MMTAREYRARAVALEGPADRCANYPLKLQLDAIAREWRRLADMADRQDSMLAALAASGDEGAS
jgi:hypothetical protein